MECPECDSEDVYIEDETEDTQECVCENCGHEWEEDL